MDRCRDGDLWEAKFYNLRDVSRGPNNTIWVTDEMRVRIIELPASVVSTVDTIRSQGRVSTIAGTGTQGLEDGIVSVSHRHIRFHETLLALVCRLLRANT